MLLLRLVRLVLGAFALLTILAVAAVGVAVARNAERSANASLAAWGGRLEHGPILPGFFPPSAVVHDLVVRSSDGTELVRAERCFLPLPPRAWLGEGKAGAPRLEGFTVRITPLSRWKEALAGQALPGLGDWSAENGQVNLGALSLGDASISRRGERIELSGRLSPGDGRLRLQGRWKSGDLSGALVAERVPGPAFSPWIVDPGRSFVRGGSFRLDGSLALNQSGVRFEGRLGAQQMLIEGNGGSGPVELALRLGGGSASIPLLYQAPFDGSPDWAATARVALAAGAPRARHGG